MSVFNVDNDRINPPRRMWDLDTDLVKGFKQAVNNNQQNLAMQYLTHIVDVLAETVKAPETDGKGEVLGKDQPAATARKAARPARPTAMTTADLDVDAENE